MNINDKGGVATPRFQNTVSSVKMACHLYEKRRSSLEWAIISHSVLQPPVAMFFFKFEVVDLFDES